MKQITTSIFLFFLVSISLTTQAETLYRGIDSEGRVTITNNPNLLKKAEKIKPSTPILQNNDAPASLYNQAPNINSGTRTGSPAQSVLPPSYNIPPPPSLTLPPLPGSSAFPKIQDNSNAANIQLQKDEERRKQINELTQDVERIKQRIKEQQAPNENEFVGIKGKGTRLSNEYFERQEVLKQDLKEAEERLNNVLQQR